MNEDSDSTLIYGGLYPEEIPSEQEQFETLYANLQGTGQIQPGVA